MKVTILTFKRLYMLMFTCGEGYPSHIQKIICVSVYMWCSTPTHIQMTICVTVTSHEVKSLLHAFLSELGQHSL